MKLQLEQIYSSFRAEESTPAEVALHGWRYLLKYMFKKRIYPSEELEWAAKCAENLKKPAHSGNGKPILTIGLAGDLMWLRNEIKYEISPELKERMKKADFWIGNLETPLSADQPVRSPYPDLIRYCSSPLLLSKFNIDHNNLFGMLSLANNHILDGGHCGLLLTQQVLDREGILYSGTGDNGIIKEFNGVKIGFYASTYGVNFHNSPGIHGVTITGKQAEFIGNARRVLRSMEEKGCHLKIFSLHWGHEYEFIPTPAQKALARKLGEAGADIILGHHPHVVQPVEILYAGGYEKNIQGETDPSFIIPGEKSKKVLVAYSLGNFMSGMITQECRQGLALILSLTRHGNFIDWEISDQFYTANSKNSLAVGFSQRGFSQQYFSQL